MAGLFNNYYYGKAGKADFTLDNLPKNRWELFCQTLRVRFSSVIVVNLLYLIFALPAILWTFVNVSVLFEASAIEDAAQSAALVQSTVLFYFIVLIPCLAIAGIGSTGEMYVLRNWARDDHSFLLSDFKDAVKGNWKQGLLVGFLNGLSLCLGYVGYIFYSQMAQTNVFFVVPQMLILMVVIVWWMINILIYPMMITYDMKFRQLVRNCAIISIARLPWSALWLAAPLVPAAVCLLIPSNYAILALAVYYLLIGFALTGYVYVSYANACFDRFLNPRIEGAPVNKGIHIEEEDDDEDESQPNE